MHLNAYWQVFVTSMTMYGRTDVITEKTCHAPEWVSLNLACSDKIVSKTSFIEKNNYWLYNPFKYNYLY